APLTTYLRPISRISGKMQNGDNILSSDKNQSESVTGEQEDLQQNQQTQQKPQRTPAFANQLPPSVSQQRVKPKRSTNALHLLFLEAGKLANLYIKYILRSLCQKNENEIISLAKDRKKLWAEFKSFANAQILEEAKEAIFPELTEKGREALSDVSPENEIIEMRFDEHEAIERSFEDAMAELRYDHYEDLGSRQSKSESDTADDEKSEAIVKGDNYPEALPTIFRIWDQHSYRRSGRDNSESRSDWSYEGNGVGGKYRMNRSTAGRPGYPPRHAPYYPPPGPRSRDGYRRGPSPNRDYRDRPERDDYYRERRYDDRRPPLSPPGSEFRRWSRDDRGPPPPAARYDSRDRDGYGRPSDDRYPSRVPARGPSPTREPRVTMGPVHPNLSGRPSKSTYEAAPVPITQQKTPEVPVESNYGYGNGYQNASAAYNSGYYGQYQNQNVGSMYGSQQAVYPAYQGQGASAQQQQWPQQFMPPLPMNSFASRDYEMSGTAIRSQAPFNGQRKSIHVLSGHNSPPDKNNVRRTTGQRLKKDTAVRSTLRSTTKVRPEKTRNAIPAVVDTLQVRMPAPQDTNTPTSSLSSSANEISSPEGSEDLSNFSLNGSLGKKMADILLEQGALSSDQDIAGSTDELVSPVWLPSKESSTIHIKDDADNSRAPLVDNGACDPTNKGYNNGVHQFLADRENDDWTPTSLQAGKSSGLDFDVKKAKNDGDAVSLEQQQVRELVEKLKKAISSHSICEKDSATNLDSNLSPDYFKLGSSHQLSSSIWSETNPIPSDISEEGSLANSYEIPSLPELDRPTLPSRQSSDADINAIWVKDQENAPIAWLSRHTKEMSNQVQSAGYACPVPTEFLPKAEIVEASAEVETTTQSEVSDASQWDENIPPSDIPSSASANYDDDRYSSQLVKHGQVDVNGHDVDKDVTATFSPVDGDDCKNSSVDHSIMSDSSALLQEENAAATYEKSSIIDSNTESSPENIVQTQTRPPRRIMHRHTYSFSRDVSLAANNVIDNAAHSEEVIQSQSVSVSFNKQYTPIEKDPIARAFHRIVTTQNAEDRDDESQNGKITTREELLEGALISQEASRDTSLTTIVDHLARLKPFQEWCQIRYLDLSHQNLSMVSGLRDCVPALEILNISHNAITHIERLPTKLQQLKAHHNRLTNCSGFSALQELSYINVSDNLLESLGELKTLRCLREMHAENNIISTWDGIRQLKMLTKLNLSCNRLRTMDFSKSSLSSLEFLNLAFNRIERLEGLKLLHMIKKDELVNFFSLDHNEIKWINIYQPTRRLELLRLSFNRLRVLDASSFPSVKTLYLDDNQLMSVKNLSAMASLESFSMRDQGGHKVNFEVKDLKRVRKLFLSGNPLPNLSEFHHFEHLEYLELCSVQLQTLPTDFSFQFPHLIVLYLGGNYLTDITPLSGCSSLQKLVLIDNRLDDVHSLTKTLKQLPSLYFLDLRLNTLTSKYYATLSNPTGPSKDLITHYLSYEHDMKWSENDLIFNRCMPDLWRGKRDEYRASILKACRKIKSLDGIKFDKDEYIQAKKLLKTQSKPELRRKTKRIPAVPYNEI
ncbi:hypothetical protein INT43_003419, partial [Umbelopsis isabellina]